MADIPLTPSFHSIPLDVQMDRVDKGTAVLNDVVKAVQARLVNEDREFEFAVRLSRLNAFENEIEKSSSEISLGYLKNYFVYSSREHATHRKAFEENVAIPMTKLREKRVAEVSKHMQHVNYAKLAIKDARAQLQKAKKLLKKTRADLTVTETKICTCQQTITDNAQKQLLQAQAKRLAAGNGSKPDASQRSAETNGGASTGSSSASMFQSSSSNSPGTGSNSSITGGTNTNNSGSSGSGRFTFSKLLVSFDTSPEQELVRLKKKVVKFKDEIGAAVESIRVKKVALYDAIDNLDRRIEGATVLFQQCERARLEILQQCLTIFCALERNTMENKLTHLSTLQQALERVDVGQDMDMFVTHCVNTYDSNTVTTDYSVHKVAKALSILDWDCERRLEGVRKTREEAMCAAEGDAASASAPPGGDIMSSHDAGMHLHDTASHTSLGSLVAQIDTDYLSGLDPARQNTVIATPVGEGGDLYFSSPASEKSRSRSSTTQSGGTSDPPPPSTQSDRRSQSHSDCPLPPAASEVDRSGGGHPDLSELGFTKYRSSSLDAYVVMDAAAGVDATVEITVSEVEIGVGADAEVDSESAKGSTWRTIEEAEEASLERELASCCRSIFVDANADVA